MKRQKTFLRYFVVAMLALVSMALVLAGCTFPRRYDVTWQVDPNATVTVEGYNELPEKVKDGDTLVFTVTAAEGYAVDEVLSDNRTVTADKDGKYSVTISGNTQIAVTVKLEVTGIKVTKLPDRLTYEAGEALDKTGMEVQLEHKVGQAETITDYRIRYQGGAAASRFSLGDTWFKVYYEDVESEPVQLTGPVPAVITVDPNGGTISDAYVQSLKDNKALSDVKLEEGILTFRYTEALTANIALPTAKDLTKGEEGDYSLNSWQINGEGDGLTAIGKETAVSTMFKASWTAHLFDFESITYELGETDQKPYLVVKGTFRAATEVYAFFTEGNRNISFVSESSKQTGKRGDQFTLRVDMLELTEAEAQDGGSFVGSWLDLRFGYDVDGRTESMELPYSEALQDVSVIDAGEIYRFGFAVYADMLKVVITMLTPYTYEMHVSNENDVLTLTIDGQIRPKRVSEFAGMKAKMDWWITSTVAAPDATIAADGKFQFKFVLSPENGFTLNTLGYAHFSIADENDVTLYKDGEGDGNLVYNALTNNGDLEKHEIPHDQFTGGSLMVSNADGTLVYYVGKPDWDAIVIYGLNPKAPVFTSSGDVELKVDDYAKPTKVYYVIKITIKNLTDEEVNALLLGNTDGDINVYESDSARMSKLGDVYTLWFDVTEYSGSQLWPNLYFREEDGTYTKMGEFGGDGDYSTNGLYAIVNGVKYSILCSKDTYSRPCLVTGTPASGETNPPETDPTAVKKEIFSKNAIEFTLVEENGKPYVKVTVGANGFASTDELKSSLEYGNTDVHDDGTEDDFEWKTPCTKVELVETGVYALWFDISGMEIDPKSEGGRFWSNIYFDGAKQEIKVLNHACDGFSLVVGDFKYTVECTGANGTWDIPCIKIKEVGAPEYTATGADIVVDSNKVYLVVSGTSENYEDAALETVLNEVYFDLQKNSYINENFDWVDNQDWARYSALERIVTVESGNWSIKFDVTALDVAAYGAHIGQDFGDDGQPQGDPKDLKIADVSMHAKFVVLQGKRYTVYNFNGSGDPEFFYGCVGLQVFAEGNFYEATKAELAQDEGKAYLVLRGVYAGYEATALKAKLESAEFDLQHNQLAGAANWDTVKDFTRTATVNDNGTWELKIDISSLTPSFYTTHFQSDVVHKNSDLKLPDKSNDGMTVTAGGKQYRLVCKFGSGEATDFWGCVGVVVEEVGAKKITAITKVDLVTESGKVYYVITLTAQNYTAEELKAATLEQYTCEKVTEDNGSFTLYFDVTAAPGDGSWLWAHLKLGDVAWDNANGDVKDTSADGKSVTIGCKQYKIQCVAGDDQTPNNTWGVAVLIATMQHTFENGLCSACGQVQGSGLKDADFTEDGWSQKDVVGPNFNLHELTKLTKGHKLIVIGTQSGALAENWDALLWEFAEGWTGRADNFGWTFNESNFAHWKSDEHPNGTSESTKLEIKNAEGTVVSFDWAMYCAIAKDCTWRLEIDWTGDDILVTVSLTANSGEYAGYTFTYGAKLDVLSAITEINVHVGAEDVTSIGVTAYKTI